MKLSREVKTGSIVIIAIFAFIWGVNFLKSRDIFLKEKKCYAFYEKVDGLVASNPVYLSGIKVGYIKEVNFVNDFTSNVKVTLIFNSKIQIPRNSIAKIYSSDLMGSKAIQILMGDSKEKIKEGDTLSSQVEADLKEEINRQVVPLKLKAEELMSSFDSVLIAIKLIFNEQNRKNLSNSFENIKVTLDNIKNMTFNVDTLVSTQRTRLSQIINNVESITHNIKNNNEKINNIISNFSSVSDTLARLKISETIINTNKVLNEFSSVLDKINQGKGSFGLLINNDSLYYNLNSSAKDLDLLLKDLKQNPDRYMRISIIGRRNK